MFPYVKNSLQHTADLPQEGWHGNQVTSVVGKSVFIAYPWMDALNSMHYPAPALVSKTPVLECTPQILCSGSVRAICFYVCFLIYMSPNFLGLSSKGISDICSSILTSGDQNLLGGKIPNPPSVENQSFKRLVFRSAGENNFAIFNSRRWKLKDRQMSFIQEDLTLYDTVGTEKNM